MTVTLSAAQMERMSRLLDDALELDVSDRRRWLSRVTAEHPDLGVLMSEDLLFEKAGALDPSSLNTLPKHPAGRLEVRASGLRPGERVGPYEVVRLLGAGGMAEVWLARRADGVLRREIALKVPLLSTLRADLERRFGHERDILAGLEHVNIARLYDAGVTAGGQPYLAMEYVPGEPLTVWCDRHRLGPRARIALFVQVLDAVQYAHAHQVVHRDLKPSNILVTHDGSVRLLDFGVARMLGAAREENEDENEEENEEDVAEDVEEDIQAQLTRIYGRAITPEYASPEHLIGERVDARSDVYSLGVVLFELLAGCRPARLPNRSPRSPARHLEWAAADPRQIDPPSARATGDAARTMAISQSQLVRALRGDVDAVVRKALAHLPGERYASAAAMADDLKRHLGGAPVRARSDAIVYVASRFLSRHRVGAAVSALGALALAIAIGFALRIQSAGAGDAIVPAGAGGMQQNVPSQFSPPPHSIAVMPFINLSGDPEQDYFSDGLSEELLNALASVRELQVAARASSFSFKGRQVPLLQVARELNVGAVLEGGVRRSGDQVRITAQLADGRTGYQLWSGTYDRDLKDILPLQAQIGRAVSESLQATLLADAGTALELGGTDHPAALDAFLRAVRGDENAHNREEFEAVVEELSLATAADPRFAKAYALKARVLANLTEYLPDPNLVAKTFSAARDSAQRAVALAPELGDAHSSLGIVLERGFLDFPQAANEFDRAVALAPGDRRVQTASARFFAEVGRSEEAMVHARRAAVLDPLSAGAHFGASYALLLAHHYREAIVEADRALALNPQFAEMASVRGQALLALGELESARASCEAPPIDWNSHFCLAIVYEKLQRHADAARELQVLQAENGDNSAYQYAVIYAQRGDLAKALDWIEKAYALRDGGLGNLKVDSLLDPLRGEPRFQEVERRMRFPQSQTSS